MSTEIIKAFEKCVNDKIQEMIAIKQRHPRLEMMIDKSDNAVEAIRKLMETRRIPPGLQSLEDNNCRDLCMEYVVLDPQWKDLFDDNHRKEALLRLIELDKKKRPTP